MLFALIALPLASVAGLRIDGPDGPAFLSFASLGGRMADMWPRAFDLIDVHGPELWLGTGFGGIGVSQGYFDPTAFSAGDNLFVFLYATLGLGAVVFLAGLVPGGTNERRVDPAGHRLCFVLAMTVLTIGLAANVIEAALPCLVLGLLVGRKLYRLPAFGRSPLPATMPAWRG
jgi:hypothetical protein